MYASFDFGWYSIQLDIVVKNKGMKGFYLKRKICYGR